MIEIDYSRAVELAKIATAFKGEDYVYTNDMGEQAGEGGWTDCYNTHTDGDGNLTPGCLVGSIFHLSGVPLERIPREGSAQLVTDELRRDGEETVLVTKKALVFLNQAQSYQDRGTTWGKSITKAEEYVNLYVYDEEEEIAFS